MKFVLRVSYSLSQLASGTLLFLVSRVEAFQRTVGPATNPTFENVSRICNGSDPASFDFGTCSNLISCVYNNLSQAYVVSLGSGTNIASLLPTILVLIGELCFSKPFQEHTIYCFYFLRLYFASVFITDTAI